MNALRFVFIFLVLSAASVTQAKTVSVDAVGYGGSQTEAISDALVQGIRQASGVSVRSQEVIKSLAVSKTTTTDSGTQFKDKYLSLQGGKISLKTKGLVSRYDVQSVERQGDGSYQARLRVYILKYEEPGISTDKRRKLAVMPFDVDRPYFRLFGKLVPSDLVEQEFRNYLIDQFTQSRKVAVLDREYDKELAAEKALWRNGDTRRQEKAKLGNVLGVDYLVVGNLRSIDGQQIVETLSLTGEQISSYSATAQIDYKIIQAATRQVKWSDTIRYSLSDEQINDMFDGHGSGQTGITLMLAEELAQKALDNVYPIRVVAVQGDTVVLNQGGKTLKTDEELNVFLLGDEMFDPYTKESLGFLEEQVAKIKVLRVTAKTTYAKVVDGDAGSIKKDFIVRR